MSSASVPNVEANLKRSISLPQALGISFHQIVGGGVVALMGTAIGLTGGGVALAFIFAAIAVIIYSVPIAAMGSAMPVTGGRYSYAARLISPSLGFVTMWFSILVIIQLSLMALAGAEYLHSLYAAVPVRPAALAVMTIFFVANLAGAAFSSKLGIVLAFPMLAAFLMYAFVGLPQVNWSVVGDVAPNGVGALLTTAALLTFAVTGSTYVAEIGHEMKRPGRDLPLSVIGGILIAVVLYVLMALPSVGILPIEQVAGKEMTVVAEHILSPAGVAFFVLGGAMVSVVGHINSLLLTATKPLLAAVGDGWLPAGLGAVNKRYGTPHWLLTLLFVIGVTPVILGFSVEAIASMVAVAATPMLAVMVIASLRLPKRFPELHASAPFRIPWGVHVTTAVLGSVVLVMQATLLLRNLKAAGLIALVIWVIVGVVVWLIRRQHVAAVVQAREEAVRAEKDADEGARPASEARPEGR